MGDERAGHNYSQMLHALACSSLSEVSTILEIGAGPEGGSGLTFARALQENSRSKPRLFSIDINSGHPPPEAVLRARVEFGVEWSIIHADSLAASLACLPAQVDLLYIDGDHGGDHAIGDYRRFSPLVRRGGIIVFDDYPIATGVVGAVAVLTSEGVVGVPLVYNRGDGNSHYVIRNGVK